MEIGAIYQEAGEPGHDGAGQAGCLFRVFAPEAQSVGVESPAWDGRIRPLQKAPSGYWEAWMPDVRPGLPYRFQVNEGTPRCDPASRHQPQGIDGPSEVWDSRAFQWTDQAWKGNALEDYILYEIHIGTFTREGTFDAAISRLPHLKELGINAIELMPVNQFPGARNWGYDGVYLFAVQNTYGGPDGLKRLVDACHAAGIAVILDVVYNHLGPEGNYLREFAPYFTAHYRTPWGSALNFDGRHSDPVRDFFIENALYWLREFHMDGLRLDAIHQIYDMSAKHFLEELEERITEFSIRNGGQRHLIAESDLNDPHVLTAKEAGGYGMQAQWLDDFQHCVDTLLRGGDSPYKEDFRAPEQFVKAIREGFVYTGEYSRHRARKFGASSASIPPGRFIAFIQNHDQVGNRPRGERFNAIVDFESYKLAAGAMVLSPYIPMLFMGEEFAADTPFAFFADYCDADLIRAVSEGRKSEFAFLHDGGEVPEPCDPHTFMRSKLDWDCLDKARHRVALEFYRELIAVRKAMPSLRRPGREGMEMGYAGSAFSLLRCSARPEAGDAGETFCAMNFGTAPAEILTPSREAAWKRVMDSSDLRWNGPGSRVPETCGPETALQLPARSFSLYQRVPSVLSVIGKR
ncbi:MAG: malto-oligosyltrehalose trehalohydrolase [Fibrobacteria bacterium]